MQPVLPNGLHLRLHTKQFVAYKYLMLSSFVPVKLK